MSELDVKEVKKVTTYECSGPGTDPFTVFADEEKEQLTVVFCWGSYSYQWSGGNGGLAKFVNRCDDGYLLKNLMGRDVNKKGVNANKEMFFKNRIFPLVRELFQRIEKQNVQ